MKRLRALRRTRPRAFNTMILAAGCLLLLAVAGLYRNAPAVSADCAPLATDRGTVTTTITIPADGTYRVWSRMKAADSNNNSFYVQIDQTTCGVIVGDNNTIAANSWTWVDYQNGNTASKISVNLKAGSHTVKVIGREDSVQFDRVILTQDMNCMPTGVGDNCANPPDTTPPVVSITSPADNTTLPRSNVTVTTNVTDNIGVAKVEFYLDGSLVSTSESSPFTYVFDATKLADGNHSLMAKAYDSAGNSASSSIITVKAPDNNAPLVSITNPTNGGTLKGTVKIQAAASDDKGVTKAELYLGSALSHTFTGAGPYSFDFDSTRIANGTSVNVTFKVYDAAGNVGTDKVTATVDNNQSTTDSTAPTVSITNPQANATLVGKAAITATASDNVGVTKVDFYLNDTLKASAASAPFTATIDTTLLNNGTYTLTAKAYDAAGNSKVSDKVTVTISNRTYLDEDINEDGAVNLLDFSLLAAKFGQTTNLGRADVNHDGIVNLLDFSLVASKFGQ